MVVYELTYYEMPDLTVKKRAWFHSKTELTKFQTVNMDRIKVIWTEKYHNFDLENLDLNTIFTFAKLHLQEHRDNARSELNEKLWDNTIADLDRIAIKHDIDYLETDF